MREVSGGRLSKESREAWPCFGVLGVSGECSSGELSRSFSLREGP